MIYAIKRVNCKVAQCCYRIIMSDTKTRYVINYSTRLRCSNEQCTAMYEDHYTVKPACNDHLYNKIYYLWLIQ